jgi:hypothetical protein
MGLIINSASGGGGSGASNVITANTLAVQISGGNLPTMFANLQSTLTFYVGYKFLSFNYTEPNFQGILIVAPV